MREQASLDTSQLKLLQWWWVSYLSKNLLLQSPPGSAGPSGLTVPPFPFTLCSPELSLFPRGRAQVSKGRKHKLLLASSSASSAKHQWDHEQTQVNGTVLALDHLKLNITLQFHNISYRNNFIPFNMKWSLQSSILKLCNKTSYNRWFCHRGILNIVRLFLLVVEVYWLSIQYTWRSKFMSPCLQFPWTRTVSISFFPALWKKR